MLEINDEQNVKIMNGKFQGKNLFDAMMISTSQDVEQFMAYIQENTLIYANQTLRISELYATWIFNGNPKIK